MNQPFNNANTIVGSFSGVRVHDQLVAFGCKIPKALANAVAAANTLEGRAKTATEAPKQLARAVLDTLRDNPAADVATDIATIVRSDTTIAAYRQAAQEARDTASGAVTQCADEITDQIRTVVWQPAADTLAKAAELPNLDAVALLRQGEPKQAELAIAAEAALERLIEAERLRDLVWKWDTPRTSDYLCGRWRHPEHCHNQPNANPLTLAIHNIRNGAELWLPTAPQAAAASTAAANQQRQPA